MSTATATATPANNMTYRFLGNTGLLVSRFSYGWFMFLERALAFDQAFAIMERAFQLGVNFIDTAETYGEGHSEEILGQVVRAGIERGTWTRSDLVINTKVFFGMDPFQPNGLNKQGLSRKHIIEGAKASLQRLGLDYVDVLMCHRPDPVMPIEETVRAMNFVINQAWALYWGTSEWSARDITEACEIADRLGLIRPIADQCEYNIFTRSRVDAEFRDVYTKYGYGLTVYSPLDGGILTGKYSHGVQPGTRLAIEMMQRFGDLVTHKLDKLAQLEAVAKELACTLAQLALAWCALNEHVSTVLFGATSIEQLENNLKAVAIVEKLTPEIKAQIEAIVPFEVKLLPRYGMMENFRFRYKN
ncbi:hypothetical protein Poli38472_014571 [Pythium oligandrum]|uniref:NADP-dependent oxidoreductase domain-containing protein n=1 Tax=Pythium oligandrum TaxID=41045 RepID=A0A8K1CNI0_PYTOL|nr:hypothetical protein Poli38472_014571 [Pythium oligandrum]|eukprot:TMW66595.1 hypothetical protein Poli38472_014571 [Pythium oligandrum]